MKAQKLQDKLQQIISLAEECRYALSAQKYKKSGGISQPLSKPTTVHTRKEKINFSLNSRAFFKEYGKNLSGPKRFVLVVAYLAKGKRGSNVSSGEVKSCWNKHKKLLGGKLTTGVYGTRAKEGGWLDATKDGFYHLTVSWQKIFN